MLCHSQTYRQMTHIVRKAADDLCEGRVIACHEGGYSPTNTPYCGLAVIETLADMRTDLEDPRLTWSSKMGGQMLLAHQTSLWSASRSRLCGYRRAGSSEYTPAVPL